MAYDMSEKKHKKQATKIDTKQFYQDKLFGASPRPLRERKDDVNSVVDDQISKMKAKQDRLAGVTRRNA